MSDVVVKYFKEMFKDDPDLLKASLLFYKIVKDNSKRVSDKATIKKKT